MSTQKIVRLIQQKFNTALKSKTNWGRNELVLLHSNIIVEVLALAIDDKYPDASGDVTINAGRNATVDKDLMNELWGTNKIDI